MTYTGYQTLEDRNNPDYFEMNGPHRCTSNKTWLGVGYYFWDSEINWAHNWGKTQYKKHMIFEGKIKYDETVFDLFGNPIHRTSMWGWREELLLKNPKIREEDLTVYNILEFAKKRGGFETKYNAIRAADYPKEQTAVKFLPWRKEFTYIGVERVQFCLLNKNNLISHSFVVIYPEKYKL